MDLVSLTYTSQARIGLKPADVDAIHCAALTYNPLDGITGVLIFNGTGFVQVIEGSDDAIGNLLSRLSADDRHSNVEVRDRRTIAKRFFPQWSMYRVDVDPNEGQGLSDVHQVLATRLDDAMRDVVDQSLVAISAPSARAS